MSLYREIPLSRTDRQIRLLHLKPAVSSADPIQVQLHVVGLDQENKAYEALSYCWGKGGQTRTIICNGQDFPVTENLFQALLSLRLEHEDRTLWIDAICIDQSNLEERTAQIQWMRSIYQGCSSLVVWLGPDPHVDGIDQFFEFAEGCDKGPRMYVTDQLKPAYDGSASDNAHISYDKEGSNITKSASPDALRGFWAAIRRAWWSRLWIIQELALPPEVVVTCGSLTLPWRHVVLGIRTALGSYVQNASLTYEEDGTVITAPKNHYISLVFSIFTYTRPIDKTAHVQSSDLAHLLRHHRWSASSDPRDKVYGLLGLADSSYGIVPRYDQSVSSCYTTAAFSIIKGSGNLDVLRSVGRPSCVPTTVQDLPSWVPDWSFDVESIPESNRASDMGNPMHRDTFISSQDAMPADTFPIKQASGPEIRNFKPRLVSNPRHLILQGYVVDSVSDIGQKYEGSLGHLQKPLDSTRNKSVQLLGRLQKTGAVVNVIREWDRMAHKHFDSIRKGSEKTGEEAYLVTLVQDMIPASSDRAGRIQQVRTAVEYLTRKSFLTKTLRAMHLRAWQTRVHDVLLAVSYELSVKEDDMVVGGASLLVLLWVVGQKFGVTKGKCFAVMPAATKKGDKIALFNGSKRPFVLRKMGDVWEMLGECYVHGIMGGEEWDEGRCVDMELC